MQVELAEQQIELLLGEVDVDGRQGKRVERQVPGGKPRIFPLVRHRDDIVADHVEPLAVAHLTGRRPHRIVAVFLEPFVGVVKEVLLAPQHPGQRLPHHTRLIFADAGRGYRSIECVSLAPALLR